MDYFNAFMCSHFKTIYFWIFQTTEIFKAAREDNFLRKMICGMTTTSENVIVLSMERIQGAVSKSVRDSHYFIK